MRDKLSDWAFTLVQIVSAVNMNNIDLAHFCPLLFIKASGRFLPPSESNSSGLVVPVSAFHAYVVRNKLRNSESGASALLMDLLENGYISRQSIASDLMKEMFPRATGNHAVVILSSKAMQLLKKIETDFEAIRSRG